MAMLAEARRKQKWSLNPRGAEWANDESKYGQKMMERMGWVKGKGLGRQEQGMTDHLSIKLKHDTKGIGYNGKDDEWIKHYEGFENVLASLNSEENSAANSKNNSTCNSADNSDKEDAGLKSSSKKSLETVSKTSRARVHYHKFTRGKDWSRYNADDIGCILGSKRARILAEIEAQKEAVLTEEEEKEEKGHMKHSDGVTTIKGGNIQEYFAFKMAALKKAKVSLEDCDEKDQVGKMKTCQDLDFLYYNGLCEEHGGDRTEERKDSSKVHITGYLLRNKNELEDEGREYSMGSVDEQLPKEKKKKKKKNRKKENEKGVEILLKRETYEDTNPGQNKTYKSKDVKRGCQEWENERDNDKGRGGSMEKVTSSKSKKRKRNITEIEVVDNSAEEKLVVNRDTVVGQFELRKKEKKKKLETDVNLISDPEAGTEQKKKKKKRRKQEKEEEGKVKNEEESNYNLEMVTDIKLEQIGIIESRQSKSNEDILGNVKRKKRKEVKEEAAEVHRKDEKKQRKSNRFEKHNNENPQKIIIAEMDSGDEGKTGKMGYEIAEVDAKAPDEVVNTVNNKQQSSEGKNKKKKEKLELEACEDSTPSLGVEATCDEFHEPEQPTPKEERRKRKKKEKTMREGTQGEESDGATGKTILQLISNKIEDSESCGGENKDIGSKEGTVAKGNYGSCREDRKEMTNEGHKGSLRTDKEITRGQGKGSKKSSETSWEGCRGGERDRDEINTEGEGNSKEDNESSKKDWTGLDVITFSSSSVQPEEVETLEQRMERRTRPVELLVKSITAGNQLIRNRLMKVTDSLGNTGNISPLNNAGAHLEVERNGHFSDVGKPQVRELKYSRKNPLRVSQRDTAVCDGGQRSDGARQITLPGQDTQINTNQEGRDLEHIRHHKFPSGDNRGRTHPGKGLKHHSFSSGSHRGKIHPGQGWRPMWQQWNAKKQETNLAVVFKGASFGQFKGYAT